VFQPTAGIIHFEISVMDVGFWAQPDLFNFDLGLGFSSLAFFLGLFEKELSHVDDFDHWRIRVCGDLHQVKPGVSGCLKSYFDGNDAPIFPVGVNKPDFWGANKLVGPYV